jgi:hypothetical protein
MKHQIDPDDPPLPAKDGIVVAGSYGDPWPVSGGKNLAMVLEQVAHRIERLGHDRTAAPITTLCEEIDLPVSSFYAIEQRGQGPRSFKLGRRRYVLLSDWRDWLTRLAKVEGNTPD